MLTLQQVIEEIGYAQQPITIMYRITLPPQTAEDVGYDDTLFGYCEWTGTKLNPLDGDDYSLKDEILSYLLFQTESGEDMLSVTVEGVPMFNPDGSINMD